MQEIRPARKLNIVYEEEDVEWGVFSFISNSLHLLEQASKKFTGTLPLALEFVGTSPPAHVVLWRIQARHMTSGDSHKYPSTVPLGFAPLVDLLSMFRASRCEVVLDKCTQALKCVWCHRPPSASQSTIILSPSFFVVLAWCSLATTSLDSSSRHTGKSPDR
jgi:hypothetical protein